MQGLADECCHASQESFFYKCCKYLRSGDVVKAMYGGSLKKLPQDLHGVCPLNYYQLTVYFTVPEHIKKSGTPT